MSEPTGTTIHPASILHIEGDPNSWGLRDVGPANPGWAGPVSLPIVVPVMGTLVLSPAQVGGLALVDPDWHNGWVPATVPAPQLYIPTATLVTSDTLYPLAPPDDDTATLTEKILNAMRTGSTITVALDLVGGGVVVLNGATLPFAVVARTWPA
jgi:hypothetical protein